MKVHYLYRYDCNIKPEKNIRGHKKDLIYQQCFTIFFFKILRTTNLFFILKMYDIFYDTKSHRMMYSFSSLCNCDIINAFCTVNESKDYHVLNRFMIHIKLIQFLYIWYTAKTAQTRVD